MGLDVAQGQLKSGLSVPKAILELSGVIRTEDRAEKPLGDDFELLGGAGGEPETAGQFWRLLEGV